MGIPYLPATGIKGLVRLAHILNLIADQEKADFLIQGNELDDAHPDSLIPEIFGGGLQRGEETKIFRGKVIFLDAYPENIPDLHVDIMNPHYVKYYEDDDALIPPADYLNPRPVQFLTVRQGTVFIFRAVVTGSDTLQVPILQAFEKALTDQGIGAKTAVGYGRFEKLHEIHTGVAQKEPPKASKIVDAEEARTEAFKRFCQNLPDITGFPGKASEIRRQIEGVEDPELKKMCVKAALDIAQSNPKKFKKALKAGKPWAMGIVELCKAVGIEMQYSDMFK
jgi:CRISPR type III-B/RAMP module RAMP protein Cmr6